MPLIILTQIRNCFSKRVYFGHLRIKRFDENHKYINCTDSKRDVNDIMQHFMDEDKYERLDSDKFVKFDFPQCAIGLNEKLLGEIKDNCKDTDTDIVLNVDVMENAILNYGFSLYRTTRKEFFQYGEVKRFVAFGDIYLKVLFEK